MIGSRHAHSGTGHTNGVGHVASAAAEKAGHNDVPIREGHMVTAAMAPGVTTNAAYRDPQYWHTL